MKQEDKNLLLKDLCGRLPYGVMVAYISQESKGNIKLTYGNIGYVAELGKCWWKECKPYLRPMSSMSGSERIIYEELSLYHEEFGEYVPTLKTFDWLNKHHFDYHGLIEKGLALEAPEGMYKF